MGKIRTLALENEQPDFQPQHITELAVEPSEITQEERSRRTQESLRVVRAVSGLIGDELRIDTVDNISDIAAPGVYWFEGDATNRQAKKADFTYEERSLSGAADSAHSVLPGVLNVERRGAEDRSFNVVAKCYIKRLFEDRLARSKREVEVSRAMYEHGELSLRPLAIVVAPMGGATRGEVVLVTERDPSLATFDNLPWANGMTQENTENADNAASALGKFNSLGYWHRDAKIKNVAQNESGRVGMIDFETTQPVNLHDATAVMTMVHSDLQLFLRSLQKKRFFGSESKPLPALEISNGLKEITDAYLASWGDVPNEVADAIVVGIMSATDSVFPNLSETNGYYTASERA